MRPVLPVLLFSLFCAPAPCQDLRETAAAMSACGPKDATFDVEPAATSQFQSGHDATLYVFSESQGPLLVDMTKKIGLDGKWLGAVKGQTYLVAPVSVGEHHLCASWQSRRQQNSHRVALHSLNVEPSKTYYFVVQETLDRAELGGTYDKIDLQPVDLDRARMLIEAGTPVVGKKKP